MRLSIFVARRLATNSFFDLAELSDVTIKLNGPEVKCHKVILTAASDYFQILCGAKSQFKEGSLQTIELKDDGDADAVEAMLAYIYYFDYVERLKVRYLGSKSPSRCFSLLLDRVEQTNALILPEWRFCA